MRYFAGLDVSLEETALCVVDEEGAILREGKAASDPAAIVKWLANTGSSFTASVWKPGRCRLGYTTDSASTALLLCVSKPAV